MESSLLSVFNAPGSRRRKGTEYTLYNEGGPESEVVNGLRRETPLDATNPPSKEGERGTHPMRGVTCTQEG